MPDADRHDQELDAWVLHAVAALDREGLALGLGARDLPLPGVAEQAALDERVVAVVADRLAVRGLIRLVAHADPVRVTLTPAGRREAAARPAPDQAPTPDGARFVFLRPGAPRFAAPADPDEQVCDFHPRRRRKGTMDPGEHCDGSGWIVDATTRESRACRCRPLRIQRNRDRRLGGRITTEILNYGLASSLHPELHPALAPIVARWTTDVDRQLDAGAGLWMTVAGWDRQSRAPGAADGALDDAEAPPRTQAEFEAAAARAGRALDADALTDLRQRETASRAGGELSLMEIRKVAETAAGSSAAAIARAAHHAGRGVALYSLSSLYRSLVHLSRHGGYRDRLDALRTADLLVLVGLDDRVLERAAQWQRDWLSEQLELIAIGRYEHLKSTVIVSTGWPLEALEAALSAETYHRLCCAAGEPLLGSRIPANAPA